MRERMRLHIADGKWACIHSSCLLGGAASIVFVIQPGGFEGQVGWSFLLLPGFIPAGMLAVLVSKLGPSAHRGVYGVLFISFNFGWYWGISYAAIKIFRAGGWQVGSPEFLVRFVGVSFCITFEGSSLVIGFPNGAPNWNSWRCPLLFGGRLLVPPRKCPRSICRLRPDRSGSGGARFARIAYGTKDSRSASRGKSTCGCGDGFL